MVKVGTSRREDEIKPFNKQKMLGRSLFFFFKFSTLRNSKFKLQNLCKLSSLPLKQGNGDLISEVVPYRAYTSKDK